MCKRCVYVAAMALVLALAGWAAAHEQAEQLPAGPIRERHGLMEAIGDNAKLVGNAMKARDWAAVKEPASKIEAAGEKVFDLFPPGSLHERSRAKKEIWEEPAVFEKHATDFRSASAGLVAAAAEGQGVPQAAKKMFATCKACHDSFRMPEE